MLIGESPTFWYKIFFTDIKSYMFNSADSKPDDTSQFFISKEQ